MGNHAKRRLLAQQYKQLGIPKPYKGKKFQAFRKMKWELNSSLHKSSFPVGSLVHDCDAWNHIIKEWRYYKDDYPSKVRGRVIVVSQFVDSNGRWSCGCPTSPEVAQSLEAIKELKIAFSQDENTKRWLNAFEQKLAKDLINGIPVMDENGIPFHHSEEE